MGPARAPLGVADSSPSLLPLSLLPSPCPTRHVCLGLRVLCNTLQLTCEVHFVCSVATQQHSEIDAMGFLSCQAMWGREGGGVGQKGARGLVCGQLIAQWFNEIARIPLYPALWRQTFGNRVSNSCNQAENPVRSAFSIS